MTVVGGDEPTRPNVKTITPTFSPATRGWPDCPTGKATAVPVNSTNTPAGSVSLLVVDDDPAVRHLLQRLFKRDCYVVACAASGAEALQMLREFLPDVVILNWMMPGHPEVGAAPQHNGITNFAGET